jgi:hypothetical protein
MGLGAYMGDFAKGFADRGDYWREEEKKNQSALASAATTLNNYIRQNPQATEADIKAFGKKIYPNGGAEAILGKGGTARAAALNAEKNARTKKNQQRADATAELNHQNALLSHASSVDSLFTNALNETLASTPFGEQPMQAGQMAQVITSTFEQLTSRYPHLDFTNAKNRYGEAYAKTRAQKRATNKAKAKETGINQFQEGITSNPSLYSDPKNVEALRKRIRVANGFDEDFAIVEDAQVQDLLSKVIQKNNEQQWEQNLTRKNKIEEIMRVNAHMWTASDLVTTDNDSVVLQQARSILTAQGITDPKQQASWLQDFDPLALKLQAEEKLKGDSSTQLDALAKTHDNVGALKQSMGWASHKFTDGFESYLNGKITNNQNSRRLARTTAISQNMYADMPNASNVVGNALSGNTKELDDWITQYNLANPNQAPITKDEVYTAVQRDDLIKFQADLKAQGDGMVNAAGDRFTVPANISNRGNIDAVAGAMNLTAVQRDLLTVMTNEGLISSQNQLNNYAEHISQNAILGDWSETGEGVNLSAIGRGIAEKTLTKKQMHDQIVWDQIRSEMDFVNNPDNHLQDFRSDIDNELAGPTEKNMNQLESDFEKMGFAQRNRMIKLIRKQNLLPLRREIAALESRLEKYGTAVPEYYDEFVNAINAAKQKESVLVQRLNAIDETVREERNQSASAQTFGVDSGDFTGADDGAGKKYLADINSRIQQANDISRQIYGTGNYGGAVVGVAEQQYLHKLKQYRTAITEINNTIENWKSNPQNVGSVPLNEILSEAQLSALEKIKNLGTPEEEFNNFLPEN